MRLERGAEKQTQVALEFFGGYFSYLKTDESFFGDFFFSLKPAWQKAYTPPPRKVDGVFFVFKSKEMGGNIEHKKHNNKNENALHLNCFHGERFVFLNFFKG